MALTDVRFNELLKNLPEDLQDKIVKMNPHPLVDIFNSHLQDIDDGKEWTKHSFRLTQLKYGHYTITKLPNDSDSDD